MQEVTEKPTTSTYQRPLTLEEKHAQALEELRFNNYRTALLIEMLEKSGVDVAAAINRIDREAHAVASASPSERRKINSVVKKKRDYYVMNMTPAKTDDPVIRELDVIIAMKHKPLKRICEEAGISHSTLNHIRAQPMTRRMKNLHALGKVLGYKLGWIKISGKS